MTPSRRTRSSKRSWATKSNPVASSSRPTRSSFRTSISEMTARAARTSRLALGLFVLLLSAPVALAAQGLPPLPGQEPPQRGGILLSLSPVAYGTLTADGLTDGDSENGAGFGFAVGF